MRHSSAVSQSEASGARSQPYRGDDSPLRVDDILQAFNPRVALAQQRFQGIDVVGGMSAEVMTDSLRARADAGRGRSQWSLGKRFPSHCYRSPTLNAVSMRSRTTLTLLTALPIIRYLPLV
jgi:hypothetical protein